MSNAKFIARRSELICAGRVGGQIDLVAVAQAALADGLPLEAAAAGDAEALEWCELVFTILANKSRKEGMQ
jgi:hypothetical protein